MAKKIESTLKDWNDVDNSLKKLGELNIQKTCLENELTEKINKIKEDIKLRSIDIVKDIDNISKDISRFTDSHKDEFLDKRTKKLNFGDISYRLVKSFKINNEKNAIISLKAMDLDFCIDKTEKINKEALKDCDVKSLEKAGISLKIEDKVRIEPNFEKLAAIRGKNND